MSSKRALSLPLKSLRTPRTVLRAQTCFAQRYVSTRAACHNTRRPTAALYPAVQPQKQQQRCYSADPAEQGEEKQSTMYEFEDIKKLIETKDENTVLIDVREPHEHSAGTIPTSLNIPIQSHPEALLLPASEFADIFEFPKPAADATVVFYCKAGVRSRAAARIAKMAGYQRVGEYSGSWVDWVRRGGQEGK